MRQKRGQGRHVPACVAPSHTLTWLDQRLSKRNSARSPDHARPPAFQKQCGQVEQECRRLAYLRLRQLPQEIRWPLVSMATTTKRQCLEVTNSTLSRRAHTKTALRHQPQQLQVEVHLSRTSAS